MVKREPDVEARDMSLQGSSFTAWGSICELLQRTGLLDEEHSSGIRVVAGSENITPGCFLYGSGAMTPSLVRAAILCQLMISDHLMPLTVAMESLKLCASKGVTLEEALSAIGWNRRYFEHMKLACSLLTDSGLVSDAEKDLLIEISLHQNLPLMKIVEQRQLIGAKVADVALNLESLVYSDTISYELAVEVLRDCAMENVHLVSVLEKRQRVELAKRVNCRIGELVVASGMVDAPTLMDCVELSIVFNRRLGSVLVEQEVIAAEDLDEVLRLQKEVLAGAITVSSAIESLRTSSRG